MNQTVSPPSGRLAVFDCDGTLVDGQHDICAAMEAAFAAQGLPAPERGLVRRAVGLSLPQAMRLLLPDAQTALHAVLDTTTPQSKPRLRRAARKTASR